MAKTSKTNTLDQLRTLAFTVTVGSAMLYGLMWAFIGLLGDTEPTWSQNLGTVLLGATVVGGMCMGLLYAVSKSLKKK